MEPVVERQVVERDSSSTGVVVGILIVIVVLLVAWIAYTHGAFRRAAPDNGKIDVKVDLPNGGNNGGNTGGNTGGAPSGGGAPAPSGTGY